ncbi:MAG: hypothetical protein K2G16_11925, partial [Lachnospiraceae bacterium]|nr:hypothetical protein [Lachnospiraceae bacterium]
SFHYVLRSASKIKTPASVPKRERKTGGTTLLNVYLHALYILSFADNAGSALYFHTGLRGRFRRFL